MNQINPQLLHEVLAVVQSSLLTPKTRTREKVEVILRSYFESEAIVNQISWDRSIGTSVMRLYAQVESFAKDFAFSTLSKAVECNPDVSKCALSRKELRRPERTFWRFELYCNLFREQQKFPYGLERIEEKDQKQKFFNHFAPFENEQLGCVHDFWYDQVSVAFNDVAAHDVEWATGNSKGEDPVRWVDDYDPVGVAYKQALLSRGLAGIQAIRNAQSYDDRYDILQGSSLGRPDEDYNFLFHGLEVEDDHPSNNAKLRDISLVEVRSQVKAPVAAENDDGPLEAWKWANACHTARYHFEPGNYFFRQRAYVMWDSRRLSLWGLLSMLRRDTPEEWNHAHTAGRRTIIAQEKSIQERNKTYEQGGLGWWDINDDTRLVFPSDRKYYLLWLEKRQRVQEDWGRLIKWGTREYDC